MKFIGRITTTRDAGDRKNLEVTEIFNERFESNSIQSAKTFLTKIANKKTLISWSSRISEIDLEIHTYTGSRLRWKAWTTPESYTQDNGIEVNISAKRSEQVSSEFLETGNLQEQRFPQSAQYRVTLTLYWRKDG